MHVADESATAGAAVSRTAVSRIHVIRQSNLLYGSMDTTIASNNTTVIPFIHILLSLRSISESCNVINADQMAA